MGNEQIVRLLLEKGADINGAGWGKDTALVCTSREGHGQIDRLLLDKGADVDVIGCDGTALVWASRAVCPVNAEKGVDINAVTRYGSTSLMFPTGNGYEQIASCLRRTSTLLDDMITLHPINYIYPSSPY